MERCEACIKCDSEYSGGRGTSCHDTCDKFQEWKERRECQKKSQFAKSAGMKLTL